MNGESHHGVRAAVWEQLDAALSRRAADLGRATLDIVDVGGGSGTLAVPLAELGHHVTVVDPSPNALATLRQRTREAAVTDRITAVQKDASELPGALGERRADVVLCHGVLEVVDDPSTALDGMGRCLHEGGLLSVVAAQRSAAAIAKAVAGHLEEALHLLEDPNGRWGPSDPLPRRFTESGLRALAGDAGFMVDAVHGLRIFSDLVPGAYVDDPADVRALAALEDRAGASPEMRSLAAALHVLASRR